MKKILTIGLLLVIAIIVLPASASKDVSIQNVKAKFSVTNTGNEKIASNIKKDANRSPDEKSEKTVNGKRLLKIAFLAALTGKNHH